MAMKNMFDLRQSLIKVFEDLTNDKIDVKKAKEITNTAGKIISTVKCQISYQQMKNEIPNISFVESAKDK